MSKVIKININFELLKVSKISSQFENLCIFSHGESRNIKFGQQAHSVQPTLSAGEGSAFNQIFKKGGLTGPQLLEGVAGKEECDFFQGGCYFHIKNKLKSEIFNDKKFHKQKYFSVITQNSNWEIYLRI